MALAIQSSQQASDKRKGFTGTCIAPRAIEFKLQREVALDSALRMYVRVWPRQTRIKCGVFSMELKSIGVTRIFCLLKVT